MNRILSFFAIFLPLLFAGCASNYKALYNWDYYSTQTYKYVKGGNEEDTEKLFEVYQKVLDGQEGTIRETIPPGLCADYGYLLIKAGKVEEGKALLRKEMELYPESVQFMNSIIRKVER
ncbi:MAG: DUF4810 domain-containing protein [Treponema sp.]|nr:DUF4810 domain-containing protein [Treponema sp.]